MKIERKQCNENKWTSIRQYRSKKKRQKKKIMKL